ncbi:glycerate kinase [Luteimicrobium xylanilyticum]|uniref:Glycerate 2-kinase n=1 Tax=Luteimicrobium xylanilyticum TaxID=1133546 RepID=A0A5P9QCJ1_9MICO|nr:glycerate kinase [Luteimicrobium xylanilyticum]QFU99164.1 Glycerate 2-kinase [Luteimicrobium xylanilyticum]
MSPHIEDRQAARSTPRVVVAPDSFKGSAPAADVAQFLADGVLRARPDAEVVRLPMADGGEGTLDALAAAWGVEKRRAKTVDALGRPTTARWATSADGRLAVVELAEASGLPGVADVLPQPLLATTFGTGLVLREALDSGAEEILVCLGGSATTDGGSGILRALGVRPLGEDGEPVADGGEGLAHVARLDLGGLHPKARAVRWRLAVDVTNPLVGERGAARVFGPQKGAGDVDVDYLDAGLERWAGVLAGATGVDVREVAGAGAAGGVAGGLHAVLGAELEPGAALVADAVGLADAVAGASLVLTGEGSFDSQSVAGKVADTVAATAARAPARPPVVVVAGQVLLPPARAAEAGVAAAFALAAGPATLAELVTHTPTLLADVAENVTRLVLR